MMDPAARASDPRAASTPGPWLLSESELDEITDCVIADITEDPAPVWGSTERVITTIRHLRDINTDLLAACEAALLHIDMSGADQDVPIETIHADVQMMRVLRAAIAQAKGDA